MSYQVGIDLGTTCTVAAVYRLGAGTARVVPLDGRTGAVPSAVYLGADGGFLVGAAAERRALSDPGRVVRDLTCRVGDATPLLVGREPVDAADLAARYLARVVSDVAQREGGVAARVAVTHPAGWGPHRVGALRVALAEHGLGSALVVPEHLAAATGHAETARVAPGAALGVYDLGGGRFRAAVVRPTPGGFEPLGTPEEIERFGGADLDEVVFAHVRTALGTAWEELDPADPGVLAAVADLRRECTAAKEALSHDTEVLVPVMLPGAHTQVRLGRAEFEEMIRPALAETVQAMQRAIDAAGTTPTELAALVLVGGSSRIPLVPQLLSEAFGRSVAVAADPLGVVATGAALLARGPDVPGPDVPGPVAQPAAAAVEPPRTVDERSGKVALAVGGPPAAPTTDARPPSPDADRRPSPAVDSWERGTAVLPVERPSKQARPFSAVAAESNRPRRIALVASAAALAVAVLGGVVAFGVNRIGAGTEADAGTPAPVVNAVPPEASATIRTSTVVQDAPAPKVPPAAPRRARPAPAAPPPATTTAPPPGTTAPPPTQDAPDEAPEDTAPPAETGDPGGGNDGADDGAAEGGATEPAGDDPVGNEAAGEAGNTADGADLAAVGDAPAARQANAPADAAAPDGQ
jgi:actin-like ATPase involved in cell morphogenesis